MERRKAFGFTLGFLLLGVGASNSGARANEGLAFVPEPRAAFCEERRSPDFARIIEDRGMRLGFENAGGLLGGGVCWWHSRFQRAIWHLAVFLPRAPRPDREETRRIVRRLATRKEVVEIPGYADAREFSSA